MTKPEQRWGFVKKRHFITFQSHLPLILSRKLVDRIVVNDTLIKRRAHRVAALTRPIECSENEGKSYLDLATLKKLVTTYVLRIFEEKSCKLVWVHRF
jgi:hypothetical protein